MADITEISAIVTAAGVLVGMVLAVQELRHLHKQRQTDLVARLYSVFTSDDFLGSMLKVRNLEFQDYDDFVQKYGPVNLETPLNLAILKVANYYDQVGTLVHEGLIDADVISEFLTPSTISFWDKLRPLIEGYRQHLGFRYSVWFEYLYTEMKKREQKWHISVEGMKLQQ